MKIRWGHCSVLLLVAICALALAGCEKERPAPRPAATPFPAGTPAGQAKAGSATNVAPTVRPGATGPTTPPPSPQPLSGAPAAGVPVAGPPAPPNGTKYFVYKVVQWDTLAQIARRFNVVVDAVISINQLADINAIAPGQELKIPGDPPEGYGGLTNYTVAAGDTLASIAARFGTSAAELMKQNNITDPNQVLAGQTLQVPLVPGGTPVSGAPVVTTAPSTGNYVVKAGETLAQIASRFGTTVAELQRLNGLANPNQLYVGQSLKVPSIAPQSRTHTVQSGETLYSIAIRYGVTVAAMQAANNITDPDRLRVGQVLKVP